MEVGPRPVLTKLAQGWWKPSEAQSDPLWVASLDEEDASNTISDSLGRISAALPQKDQCGLKIEGFYGTIFKHY